MKILLDHNLDRRLKDHLTGYVVTTAYECGWADLTNGELLAAAEAADFNVLLTADANMISQQNLIGRRIAILALRANDNRRVTHLEMIDQILVTLQKVQEGKSLEVFHPGFARKDREG